MLEHARGLTADVMRAISELEERVVAAAGGRLKLVWKTRRGGRGGRGGGRGWGGAVSAWRICCGGSPSA